MRRRVVLTTVLLTTVVLTTVVLTTEQERACKS